MKRALLLSTVLILACAAGAAQNCAMPNSKDQSQNAAAKIPKGLQRYSASLSIDLKPNGVVEQQAWRSASEKNRSAKKVPLAPSSAYVRCMLAGDGEVLRFGCANGFRPVNPVQTPPNANGFVEDTPTTTGTTLQRETVNTVTYDCVRAAVAPHQKPNAKK